MSVILPTFNRSSVLPRAIDSVLNQTLNDLELIIVDDGSTDETQTVIEAYEDERIQYIEHSTNMGVSQARNTGLRASRGEYVAFLDSDDTWLPQKLERQVTHLRSASANTVAAYCNVTRRRNTSFKQAGEYLFSEPVGYEGGSDLLEDVLALNVALHSGSTLLVDRAAISNLWFDPQLEILEDVDFLLQILERGRLVHVDETLVELYETGYAPASAEIRARRTFLDKHAARIEALDVSETRIRARHELFIAKALFREGRFVRGSTYLSWAHIPEIRQLAAIGWSLAAGMVASQDRMIQ